MTPRPIHGPRGLRGSPAREHAAPEPRVLPLGGQTSLAVDADAVRRRIGAWVATQPAGERPGVDALWRDALLVADQALALAGATLGTGDTPLWAVDVRLPATAQELATLSGLAPRSVHRATDALIAAEALDGVGQIGSERVVRLRPEVLADAPVLAAVRWSVVRDRLGADDAPIARLIVRELARRTTPEARAQAHFVSASQRELAEAVGYSKGSMRRHLDALVGAGLLVSRSRDRANSWHRLQPVVFEAGDPSFAESLPPRNDPRPARPARPEPDRPALERPARKATSRGSPGTAGGSVPPPLPAPSALSARSAASPIHATPTSPAAPATHAAPTARARHAARTSPVDAALTLEVNGVRVALPAGVELTLEQDDSGAMWYRAGALRLGPVRFD